MENPVENRRSDYRISEDLPPISVRLVRRENYRSFPTKKGTRNGSELCDLSFTVVCNSKNDTGIIKLDPIKSAGCNNLCRSTSRYIGSVKILIKTYEGDLVLTGNRVLVRIVKINPEFFGDIMQLTNVILIK